MKGQMQARTDLVAKGWKLLPSEDRYLKPVAGYSKPLFCTHLQLGRLFVVLEVGITKVWFLRSAEASGEAQAQADKPVPVFALRKAAPAAVLAAPTVGTALAAQDPTAVNQMPQGSPDQTNGYLKFLAGTTSVTPPDTSMPPVTPAPVNG